MYRCNDDYLTFLQQSIMNFDNNHRVKIIFAYFSLREKDFSVFVDKNRLSITYKFNSRGLLKKQFSGENELWHIFGLEL